MSHKSDGDWPVGFLNLNVTFIYFYNNFTFMVVKVLRGLKFVIQELTLLWVKLNWK